MSGAKKKDDENPLNDKIQNKFDLVFENSGQVKKNEQTPKEDFDLNELSFSGDSSMSESAKKNEDAKPPKIDLDFDLQSSPNLEFNSESSAPSHESSAASGDHTAKLAIVPEDHGLELSFNTDVKTEIAINPIDFSANSKSADIPKAEPKAVAKETKKEELDSSFELDFNVGTDVQTPKALITEDAPLESFKDISVDDSSDDKTRISNPLSGGMDFDADIVDMNFNLGKNSDDGTKKTIIFGMDEATKIALKTNFVEEKSKSQSSVNASADHMSTEEAKANIEMTIKDILRPKEIESTQEFDLSELTKVATVDKAEVAEEEDKTRVNQGFSLSSLTSPTEQGEFNLDDMNFDESSKSVVAETAFNLDDIPDAISPPAVPDFKSPPVSQVTSSHADYEHTQHAPRVSAMSDEDATRVHGTIRQLREEREDLMTQCKMLKSNVREIEQDNLTLKAALDEAKIEIALLRKRHLVEIEDFKYRLSLNEEKRELAEEKSKIAEAKREKLEQRVRIDFNQVKQREKELETKLEMLTIDVDSQVHSRDQKIIELRRKIDALEFNMENVSIKEQKSFDDKKKLEDKLNKIMKTLRHSIKNLEDDIDDAIDEGKKDEGTTTRSKS